MNRKDPCNLDYIISNARWFQWCERRRWTWRYDISYLIWQHTDCLLVIDHHSNISPELDHKKERILYKEARIGFDHLYQQVIFPPHGGTHMVTRYESSPDLKNQKCKFHPLHLILHYQSLPRELNMYPPNGKYTQSARPIPSNKIRK